MDKININKNNFWKGYQVENIFVYIKGYIYSHTIDDIIRCLKIIKVEEISNFINSLDGHFALVVKKDEITFIAVDKVRSTPLFFSKINDNFYVDSDPSKIIKNDGFSVKMSSNSILEMHMSGYTIGNKTIFTNLFSLKAGELVVFRDNNFKYEQYYRFLCNAECAKYKGYDYYIEKLSKVTLNVFTKMLSQIGERQIIIPLSAGNDSRLVASILKHLGAKNVKCYSYGSFGNFESDIAKIVANKLGYEYIFLPIGYNSEKKYYSSNDYRNYLKFSETYCSIPYTQGLSTIKYLKDMNWIDKDAVFINGNTGDFISGGHIDSLLKNLRTNNGNKKTRKEIILNSLIDKHFSLWGWLKTERNLQKIKASLWREITLACGEISHDKDKDHKFYEYSEFIDRQSKYVITCQRSYEFYGYDWRLPLWDDEYLNFWKKIPPKFKENQMLYIDMLKKKNFGDVWGNDIPVNKREITPKWIVPIRLAAKIFFGFFGKGGKAYWKQFDKVFFNYWMINTHTLKSFSYLDILKDFNKKPRGIYACWASSSYVKKLRSLKYNNPPS